ncbi:glucokinase [Thiocapsa imhoffii]|uniref:Glucokinase n=1 Tax=Thiocapsa imhoffii TaxID=382777 RepID=A0A9X1B8V9_9GAMM|nr:glucokinase [Thiocapsa imhoffii]MBK1644406.1 glucokinase [Thiocapsa imhoffii]
MQVLVGDIGGTKTALGLATTEQSRVVLQQTREFASAEFASLAAIVQRYLTETDVSVRKAAFAVAGPVRERASRTTNLPWELDADALEQMLGFSNVVLLNDLEATAWSLTALAPADLATLYPGESVTGNACVVAAGTGLGEAGLFWDGQRYHPFATEGGHADFAPTNALESALYDVLTERFGHVSWERVVSGMGIRHLHDFLLVFRGAQRPDWLSEAARTGDEAAAIAQAAAAGSCPICMEAMALFFRLYGREAGNMALKQMALGGVFLAGGIAPKNLDALKRSAFLDGFFDKGRLEPLMRAMPVHVIMQPHAPLIGAARFMAAQ